MFGRLVKQTRQNTFAISRKVWAKLPSFQTADNRKRKQKHLKTVDYQVLENRQVLSANFPAFIGGNLTLGNADGQSPYALSDTFKLQSNPDATKTVYLDFNGHYSSGNSWNHSINFPAYNTSGSSSSFSQSELIEIQKIFQNVAEDFLPLNVNVTTQDPGSAGLARGIGSSNEYGIRLVMTQQTGSFGAGTGGLAKRNSFTDRRDSPAFVFNKGINDAAWTASHEAGHSMGLSHDGFNGLTYHPGVGTGETGWGPIMGGSFGKSLTQWSDGSYAGADNHQDDLSVMTRRATGIQLQSDDVGNTRLSADDLKIQAGNISDWGTITSRGDVDFFKFTVVDSRASISVNPFQGKGNLDVMAKLYSENGDLLATSNPLDLTSASINKQLTGGTYFLSVEGVGRAGRYTDYGSLGFYSIEGNVEAEPVDPDPVQGDVIGESGNLSVVNNHWQKVDLENTFQDPVVIAGPASANDASAGTVRIRNVQPGSFEIRMENWDYLGEEHADEFVSYMVVESGKHQLKDGTTYVAGNGVISHRFRRVGFGGHFQDRPVVFTQVISDRGDSTVSPRVNAVSTGSFGVQLQEEEANDGTHKYERFSWLAIEEADSNVKSLLVEGDASVNHTLRAVNFGKRFASTPVFLAGTQTKVGDDPAVLRTRGINNQRASIFLQEEKSDDEEVVHSVERFGYLLLRPGVFYGQDSPVGPGIADLDRAFEVSEENKKDTNEKGNLNFSILDSLHTDWLAGH